MKHKHSNWSGNEKISHKVENIFAKHEPDKGLIPKMYTELLKLKKKNNFV